MFTYLTRFAGRRVEKAQHTNHCTGLERRRDSLVVRPVFTRTPALTRDDFVLVN